MLISALVFLESQGLLFNQRGMIKMTVKVFKSHNVQLKILRSRGLKVDTRAKKILVKENYYNVINGYKDLFLDQFQSAELFKAGTDFFEIVALYEFDRELRFIFLKRLLKIENQIKSVVVFKFSEKYKHDNYLKLSNFNYTGNSNQLSNIMNVISSFQRTVSDQSSKHNSITHYVTQYGYVPLWVLVNVLSFGQISKFYGILKHHDKQSIAREFRISDNVFFSYLKFISIFRNICAHDERLYNFKLTSTEIVSGYIHQRLGIPRNSGGKYTHGTNDVFALLICIKEFLPQRVRGEFAETKKEIEKELTKLQTKLKTIQIDDVLEAMGFPHNWKSL